MRLCYSEFGKHNIQRHDLQEWDATPHIPDAILRKPGKLEAEEYALMKKHPEYGWAVLRSLPGFERAALDILHHHENYGGMIPSWCSVS